MADAAATAASDAISPASPMDVDGGEEVPLSPSAAAAIAAAPALEGIVRMAIQLVEHHGAGPGVGPSGTQQTRPPSYGPPCGAGGAPPFPLDWAAHSDTGTS